MADSLEVFAAAPIQARVDTTYRLERLAPLLLAESINNTQDFLNSSKSLRIDFWNNISRKIDEEFKQQNVYKDRYEFSSYLLDLRYTILKDIFGLDRSDRLVVRDDEKQYMDIARLSVEEAMRKKKLEIRRERLHFCPRCSKIIAPADARIEKCLCGYSKLEVKVCDAMFLDFGPKRKQEVLQRIQIINSTKLLKDFTQRLNSMPENLMVSKQRDYGLNLEFIGLDMVMDPKLSLAVFPRVLVQITGLKLAASIQGIDTSGYLAPIILLMCPEMNSRFVFIRKMPPLSIEEAYANSQFVFPYLLLNLFSVSYDLSQNTFEDLKRECTKTIYKYRNTMHALSSIEFGPVDNNLDSRIFLRLENVKEYLMSLKYRSAILNLRHFIYSEVSKRYVRECKEKEVKVGSEAIAHIMSIFKLLYGYC